MNTDRIGFSTGALERGNFRAALDWMIANQIRTVELSALRFEELAPLLEAIPTLPLDSFQHISVHAPSGVRRADEATVAESLRPLAARGWNIVLHPDVIRDYAHWRPLGERLLIENMDRRKPIGRTVSELHLILPNLPEARICLDVAHARELDPSMKLLGELVAAHRDRIAEIHISELDARCSHIPMSAAAVSDYRPFLAHLPAHIPVVIESMLDATRIGERMAEFGRAAEAMG
jgi:hypothetical protein